MRWQWSYVFLHIRPLVWYLLAYSALSLREDERKNANVFQTSQNFAKIVVLMVLCYNTKYMLCNMIDHSMDHSHINRGIVVADGRLYGIRRSTEWWYNPVSAYPNGLNVTTVKSSECNSRLSISFCITVMKMYINHVYIGISFISLRPGESWH